LNIVDTEKPDIILMDVLMPKLSGLEVIKKIREKEGIKNIPIIVISNLDSNENIAEALESGVYAYVIKTDRSLDEIVEVVKKVLL
jgi:putative two-component system response regulator